jgi:hypothetical protein
MSILYLGEMDLRAPRKRCDCWKIPSVHPTHKLRNRVLRAIRCKNKCGPEALRSLSAFQVTAMQQEDWTNIFLKGDEDLKFAGMAAMGRAQQ